MHNDEIDLECNTAPTAMINHYKLFPSNQNTVQQTSKLLSVIGMRKNEENGVRNMCSVSQATAVLPITTLGHHTLITEVCSDENTTSI